MNNGRSGLDSLGQAYDSTAMVRIEQTITLLSN